MRPAHAILGSTLHSHRDQVEDRSPPRRRNDSRQQQELAQDEHKERELVAHSSAASESLPPQEIAQDPKNKELGKSSQALRIQDFDLVKTLGTGMDRRVLPTGLDADSPP